MGKKPKIGLIIPPSPFLCDERVFPALGILKVAAVLEQKGYPLDVLDLNGVENYLDCLLAFLNQEQYLTHIGITVTTPQVNAVHKIINCITVNSQAKIILGGPHITAAFASLRTYQKGRGNDRGMKEVKRLFDATKALVLVAGDGELAIERAIQANVSCVDADDPDSSLFLSETTLNALPFPARHLIDMESYHYSIEGCKATSLIGELGCSYGCAFCSGRLSPSFRRIRPRSPENITHEMLKLYDTYGYSGLMFSDDELNIPTNFSLLMKEIIELQMRLGIEFRLRGFIKANLFTEEQARLMYEAGFRNLLTGFESGSNRILTNIEKKSSKAQNTRCMEIAHKYGLKVKALMSLGHAGETEETARETHDWLLDVKPNDFDCTIITVYPGTPYYDFAQRHSTLPNVWTFTAKNGDRLHAEDIDFAKEDAYYKGIPGEYQSFVFTDALKPDDVVRLRDWIETDVRQKLGLPFYQVTPAMKFEASTGQLPGYLFRKAQP